jgi:hypothetical protein
MHWKLEKVIVFRMIKVWFLLFFVREAAIFQLYRDGQFNWWGKPKKTTDEPPATDNLYHIMLYRIHLAWTGLELTTLMVIGTDCIGSYKSNYDTIMTTTVPIYIMQCLSPLTLWVWIPLRRGVFDTTLVDEVCQWLAAGRWFSPVSSTNKSDRHDITEILLKVAWTVVLMKSCGHETLAVVKSTCNLQCECSKI